MKYFISYTTKDPEITKDLLEKLKETLYPKSEVYIDLIDNDSTDRQARVLAELDKSNVLLLIETESVYDSPWVKIEINRAKSQNIEVRILAIDDVKKFISNFAQLQE